jgi:tRNA(fMet)-specific endonuclease VapC
VKYLLDTDHLSILQRQTGPEFAAILFHINQIPVADVGVSVISFHEQVLGCHTYLTRAKSTADLVHGYGMLQALLRLYLTAQVVSFDHAAEQEYDQIMGQKIRVGTMDLRIAAIALSRQLVVVTRNQSDFGRVPGLQTEDWTK